MASTTCGWQCPVEVTAMPAEKSKNSFPSTSVTTMPRPCFATRGYERVYEGEMYLSSPSRICLALGPGSVVLILGPTARVLVDMGPPKNSCQFWVLSSQTWEDRRISRCRRGWGGLVQAAN